MIHFDGNRNRFLDDVMTNNTTPVENLKHETKIAEPEDVKADNTKADNVNHWNEEFAKTNEMIKGTVPQVQELYDRLNETLPEVGNIYHQLLNFSDTFNKEYVRKMADSLIGIYMNIKKMYDYHKPLSENSNNNDYIYAVDNYVDFMEMIEETLSIFGVETIVSSLDTPFDGSLHEANNMDFNPSTGRIQGNISPGFRYNGRVIRKETVIVK